MTYVIAEPCINTKDTACVDACPVDCIHPKKDDPKYATEALLYIDPVECIDCGACVPVCPVSAIFALDDLPEKWNEFTVKVPCPLHPLPPVSVQLPEMVFPFTMPFVRLRTFCVAPPGNAVEIVIPN